MTNYMFQEEFNFEENIIENFENEINAYEEAFNRKANLINLPCISEVVEKYDNRNGISDNYFTVKSRLFDKLSTLKLPTYYIISKNFSKKGQIQGMFSHFETANGRLKIVVVDPDDIDPYFSPNGEKSFPLDINSLRLFIYAGSEVDKRIIWNQFKIKYPTKRVYFTHPYNPRD